MDAVVEIDLHILTKTCTENSLLQWRIIVTCQIVLQHSGSIQFFLFVELTKHHAAGNNGSGVRGFFCADFVADRLLFIRNRLLHGDGEIGILAVIIL